MRSKGFVLGATLIWLLPSISEVSADQALTCTIQKHNFPPPTTLLIKGDLNAPTEIIWPSSSGTGTTTFTFTSISDAHYMAEEQNPKTQDSASKIFINRLSGELVLENYISHEARNALIKLCDGQITVDQCTKEQDTIKGGNPFACFSSDSKADKDMCARWKNRSNLLAIFYYDCVPTQRKF